MSYDPNQPVVPSDHDSAARDRVLYPALFLLLVSALNLVAALGLTGIGFFYQSVPPEQMGKLEQIMAERNPAQWDELQRHGYTIQNIIDISVRVFFSWGGISAAVALLILIGAIRMMQMRSHGLAVFASILSCVPFLSPSCCLGLGLIAGVWSLVVLLDGQVTAAFR